MKQLYSTLVWLLFFTLFLTSCRLLDRKSDPSAELEGEILIWHTWDGAQQAVLEELFDNFSELFPGVTIVGERFAPDNLQAAFKEQAVLGLGPDILIASADWAQDLHQQGLVKDIQSADLATDEFLANALGVLQNEDDLFGLPFTLNTFALYYNRSLLNPQRSQSESDAELAQLVQAQQAEITNTATLQTLDNLLTQFASERSEPLQPPANLEELLQQANAGHKVAMRSDFYGAFWGIQAFGGQLFDAENRVILNQGGFANWLSWLKRAGDNPNVILNRRSRTSTDLFINGDVTYYVGLTTDFPILQEALGAENVGVARLPGRQNKPAGPLLEVEAIMFSRAATDTSYAISLRLAQYLTSNEQQKELALLAGKLPTNNQVRIDPRVSPVMAEFIAQGRTAVPIRLENRTIMSDILKLGNDFYALVLDGEIGVVEAANSLTQQVNDTFGLETLVASALDACDVTGTVALWHSWSGKKEEALIATRDAFIKGCPEANILLVKLEQTELFDRLSSDGESRKPPALILGVNQWIIDLASQGIIRDIDAQIDPDFLQRYAPVVERAARFNTKVYGIPVNLDVAALYYNTRMVEDPPAVLDDVLTFATPDTPFAMPLGFSESYWGISAFGASSDSLLFDATGRFMIAESGLSEWLSWLQQAQNQQGFVISRDKAQLQTLFMEGEAAYLVGKAAQLTTLQEVMGVEAVGVVPLPSGAPLLGVDLLMIHQQANEEEQRLGLTFAEFLTDIENQLYFIEQANQIPVNINVDITPFPAIDGFVQQLEFVTVLSNRIEMQPVFQWGELVYEQVFENGIDPIDAVADFANTVDVTNGLDVVEVVMPEGAECVDEGKLALWHSWSEPEAVAWQQVIADFVVLCPNIEITTTFVEPAVFTAALTETLEVGSSVPPPDFFIGTHNRLGSYLEANLVRDIASLTDSSELTAYVPKAVAGFSLGDQLYGLPSSMNFPVLYYRSDKIVETATTFDNLLDQANDGVRVGMNASFTELLWGASAFGCGVCASAEYFDDQNALSLSATELAEWGAWLKTAKVTGQFIFDDDEEMLATLFIDGKIDYLVAGSQLLNTFQAQLGRANVGVTVLPNGPDNQLSTPTMQVSGFLFFLRATEKQTELALRFARFATQQDSQTFLMQAANFVPTNNLAVISADDPTIRNFTDAIERTVLRLSDEEIARIAAEESFIPIFDGLATSANEGN